MSEIDYNKEHEEAKEEFIFNNLVLEHLPSDVMSFTNNSMEEFTFMRSLAVFSLRSKYANGKVILTFPININPFNKDPQAISSRDQGFKMLSQVANYPFTFIKSKRVYSYISDKAKKSSSGYMLFAIDEVKVSQHLDVQDVLFLEISLMYCDHTSHTADFSFLSDPASTERTVNHLYNSKIYNDFCANLYKKSNNIYKVFDDIQSYMKTNNTLNEGDVPLSKVLLFAPQILSQTDPEAVAIRVAAEDFKETEVFKEIKITSDVGDTFLTSALINQTENVKAEDSPSQEYSLDNLYVVHRAFHDLEMGGDANVQRISCSRKNKLAIQHVGGHQNPFIQYMGRYPARVEIDLIFNNKDVYKHDLESSIAAVNAMSSIISYNNSEFPEVSAYNTLKIKSLAAASLEIVNIVPNQTSIQASSNSRGLEYLTLTFVESEMEEFLKVGNVINGRSVSVMTSAKVSSMIRYLNSFKNKSTASTENQTISNIENPDFHKEVLKSLYSLHTSLRSETIAGARAEQSYFDDQKVALESLDNFPKTISTAFIDKLLLGLVRRTAVMDMKAEDQPISSNGVNITPTFDYEGRTVDIRQTFSQSGLVDNMIQVAFYQLTNLSSRGDSKAKFAIANLTANDIDKAITEQLFNYTGTNIPDLNLDLVGNKSEAYLKNLQPFFFLQNKKYYDAEDIREAVKLGDEAINNLIDNVVNKNIADNTKNDSILTEKVKFIRDERVMTEENNQSSGGSTSIVGLPNSGPLSTYSSSEMPDWNTLYVNPNQQKIRDMIKEEINKVNLGSINKETFTRLMIQIAGLESALGSASGMNSGGYVGIYQLGVAWIQDQVGISQSQAQGVWTRVKVDHRYNIQLAIKSMIKRQPTLVKDGNHFWAAYFIYHNFGDGGARTVISAYNKGTGAPTLSKALASNQLTKYGYTITGSSAKDVKNYVEGFTAYINKGVYGTQKTEKKEEKSNTVLQNNNNLVYPSDKLKDNTQPAKVLAVLDGDTISVQLANGKRHEIRFANIDAPEIGKSYTVKNHTVTIDNKKETFPELTATVPGQKGGDVATKGLQSLGVTVNTTVLVDKKLDQVFDAYERPISNIHLVDGTDINFKMVEQGYAFATSSRSEYAKAMNAARKEKKGIWAGEHPGSPKTFRDTVQAKAKEESLLADAKRRKQAQTGTDKATENNKKEEVKAATARRTTNDFRPFIGNYGISKPHGGFGERDVKTGSKNHAGLDFALPNGTPIIAAGKGIASVHYSPPRGGRANFGHWVQINHGNGFISKYCDLSKVLVRNGQYVDFKQQIGLSGNSGSVSSSSNFHLHYEVRYNGKPVHPYYTTQLNEIPAGGKAEDYVDKDFKSGRYSKFEIGTQTVNTNTINGTPETQNATFNPSTSEAVENDAKSHATVSRGIDLEYSVYNEDLQVQLQSQYMSYQQDYGLNMAFPVLKAYITVGNENEDYTIGSFVRLDQYFEITGLEDMELACNNDDNPVDLMTLMIANPSFIRLDNYAIMGHFLKTDYTKIGTNLESQFIGDRLTVRPGMKLHVKAGYGNDPNKLKTVFNGSIQEISNSDHYTLRILCEGFGKELINYYHSPQEVTKAGGVITNSSTPMVIGTALQADSIAHFGERASFWKAFIGTSKAIVENSFPGLVYSAITTAYNYLLDGPKTEEQKEAEQTANPVLGGTSISGHNFKDPENKRLTKSFSADSLVLINFSLSDYKQRLYTNIYAAEISYAHAEYNSSFWTYFKNLFAFGKTAGYHYLYYNTTPWQAVKEMEYRNPGTLAKPLFYDDRMSIFYGIKEQLYIARDLDPVFMALAGANDSENMTKEYLSQRSKRFDTVSTFHILSTNTNIITNNMGLNGQYATSINVLYFDSAGDFENNEKELYNIKVDDDLVSWEYRQKTVSHNGTHAEYSAWMYGIQELKRECETMYGGKIHIVGDPTIKAGDYCYIQDDLRKITGIVKVRECYHYMNSRTGYTTVIVPGQLVEPKSFIYSMLFVKLGFASKLVLANSAIAMKYAANGDKLFSDYLEAVTILSEWTEDKGFLESLKNNGSMVSVGTGAFVGILILATKIFADKRGISFSAATVLQSLASGGKSAVIIGANTARIFAHLKFGDTWNKVRTVSKAKAASLAARANTASKSSILMRLATIPYRLTVSAPMKIGTSVMLSTVFRASRALSLVASVASAALLSNPIGWLVNIAGFILFGYVNKKIEEAEFTRQPLLFFPVNLAGRPYQAGMRGYQRNTWWEAKTNMWDRNIKEVGKAASFVELASNNGVQKYMAGFIAKHTTDNTNIENTLNKSAERVEREQSRQIKEVD